MRILHLSAYDLFGGAAKAAFRLHTALVDSGEDSLMLVRRKDSDRPDVLGPAGPVQRLRAKLQRRLEAALFTRRATGEFSVSRLPDGLVRRVRALSPDVVHVHWVSHGFLRLETLASLEMPLVWTMHDMWPFTGGCHYAGGCERFQTGCGLCPLISVQNEHDISTVGVKRRRDVFGRRQIVFVAPSRWMAECAKRSALLATANVHIIPNTLDVARFCPRDREKARKPLGLPKTAKVILAGSMAMSDSRKGGRELREILKRLPHLMGTAPLPEIAVFGTELKQTISQDGLTVHELGVLVGEDAMADAYAAADVFIATSRQDNLPNTVMEALAVGTPVVAFRVGGIPDMVRDGESGILVDLGDLDAMAGAVSRMLVDDSFRKACGIAGRATVTRRFSPAVVTAAHKALYAECVRRN